MLEVTKTIRALPLTLIPVQDLSLPPQHLLDQLEVIDRCGDRSKYLRRLKQRGNPHRQCPAIRLSEDSTDWCIASDVVGAAAANCLQARIWDCTADPYSNELELSNPKVWHKIGYREAEDIENIIN